MANYVENIQVGNGESWPVRDADAQEKLSTMSQTLTDMNESITGVGEDVEQLKTEVQTINSMLENDTDDGSYLSIEGGAMTGSIDMGNNAITNLPSPTNSNDAATKQYVDGIRPLTTVVSIVANTATPLTLTEGQAVTFTYVTDRTTNGDIIMSVNRTLATNANYTYSANPTDTCFTGSIVSYSGNSFNAQVSGVIRLLNNRVIVSTQDFRGNGTGIGWSMNFWNNVAAVNEIAFSADGILAYNYLQSDNITFG